VQFVAFLGAYKQHADLSPLAAGVIGSLIVNWVTYLPCFLWIFVGGPYIERLRGNRLLSCALSAITAAVVGVILNLAIWFAMKALLGKLEDATYGPISVYIPTQPHFSWGTLLLFAGSAIAIFRFHRNLFEVLAVAVATGAVMWWSGVR
jgi:chromate transporter